MSARSFFTFTPEPERSSGVTLRPKLVGSNIPERILYFLRLSPGASTTEIQAVLRLDYPPHSQLAKLKKQGLIRVEHGLVAGRRGVAARWTVI